MSVYVISVNTANFLGNDMGIFISDIPYRTLYNLEGTMEKIKKLNSWEYLKCGREECGKNTKKVGVL